MKSDEVKEQEGGEVQKEEEEQPCWTALQNMWEGE